MKTHFITQKGTELIIYFAGWGTPISTVNRLAIPTNHDVLLCYGYQDLQLDFDFSAYHHIKIVAWSLGVWVAQQFNIPAVQYAVAINGTPLPCNAQYGIIPEVFWKTVHQLNATTRQKFEKRMCGTTERYQQYQNLANPRDLCDIQTELDHLAYLIHTQPTQNPPSHFWTHAIISEQDKIFLAAQQIMYWQQYPNINIIKRPNSHHYLFSEYNSWQSLWTI